MCVRGLGSQYLGWEPGRTAQAGRERWFGEGARWGPVERGRWAEAAGIASRCPVLECLPGTLVDLYRNLSWSFQLWLEDILSSQPPLQTQMNRPLPRPILLEACRARGLRLPVAGRPPLAMCCPWSRICPGLCACSLSPGQEQQCQAHFLQLPIWLLATPSASLPGGSKRASLQVWRGHCIY